MNVRRLSNGFEHTPSAVLQSRFVLHSRHSNAYSGHHFRISEPEYINETEASVYDLKDHPDFKFSLGTQVIRVGNFEEGEVTCIVGDLIDYAAEGRIKVCWVDGHCSMCWPQDIIPVSSELDYSNSESDFKSSDKSKSDSLASELKPLIEDQINHLYLNLKYVQKAIDSFEKTTQGDPMNNQQV